MVDTIDDPQGFIVSECYECCELGTLIYKSLCGVCTVKRLEFNMTEEIKGAVPTVQIENDRVIVTEWRFAPGAETTLHTHEYDYVVVPQTTGQLLIKSEAVERISDLVIGKSYSREKGVKHNVVNINNYEFIFIEIEMK